jgi:choline dehydrogenase
VTSITFGNGGNGTSMANGITFTDQPTGQFITVSASKEVIVSMGAFNTPQLMMISVGSHKVNSIVQCADTM